jgi:hypothetical protein
MHTTNMTELLRLLLLFLLHVPADLPQCKSQQI